MNSIPFTNSYANLGEEFCYQCQPHTVADPHLICYNQPLAEKLGLKNTLLSRDRGLEFFSGNKIPVGAQPLAMAYSGHQFGHFSPQLGDGRAILLGNIVDTSGKEHDLQLKGSGKTYFSRNGDGRSALGPVIREYLLSEAMHKLGIPTTRALAAVTTGETVMREKPIPGGIITRISASFVRVGTFQYFSSQNNQKAVKKLADYVIARNYPTIVDLKIAGDECRYRALLKLVIKRQAILITKWMHVGFVHGVMNTDNMSVAGETIDYGPCAFMDGFEHNKVFSFIDKNGRYAYTNQPSMALWNLTRFAETLLSLLATKVKDAILVAEIELNQFIELYQFYWLNGMKEKLGIYSMASKDKTTENSDVGAAADVNVKDVNVKDVKAKDDEELIEDLFELMSKSKADFTLTFRELSMLKNHSNDKDEQFLNLFDSCQKNKSNVRAWLKSWRTIIGEQSTSEAERIEKMQRINPAVVPRNHQVEAAIRAAEDNNDFGKFNALNEILKAPFESNKENESYRQPPKEHELVQQTFCGT